jgi:LysR substrate binding domain
VRAQLQSLTDFKRACAAEPIEFRIASGNSVVEWLLVPNLARVTAGAPAAQFAFQNMRTAEVVRGLKEHSIDFGILRKSAVVAPLKFHSIGQIGYALFAPAAWAKEKQDATTLLSQRPICNFCRRRVQQAFSRVLRKDEADSKSPIQLREFHPGGGVGARRPCRRATSGNGRAQSSGIGRETIGVCTYAQLPSQDRCRLASAACFHPAASGLGFGRA